MESVPKLVNDYMNKKLMVDEFVTHTLPFAQINEAFDLMHAGKRYLSYNMPVLSGIICNIVLMQYGEQIGV